MLNITHYQRNANQKHNEVPFHTSHNGCYPEVYKSINAGEKGTLLHCWWECKLVQPLWRTVWRFLKKLEIELPYDPAIPRSEERRVGTECSLVPPWNHQWAYLEPLWWLEIFDMWLTRTEIHIISLGNFHVILKERQKIVNSLMENWGQGNACIRL